MDITINYDPNEKQKLFHISNCDQVIYGGAKGGGKTCALVMECLAYALENPGAEMYIFRETYDDLEANVIREWKEKVPKELYSYHESKHIVTMVNGTVIKFRYIRNYQDANSYQGRSMDWVGVDELTKHEERSIQALLSCLRSPKGFKPRFRATCNPGGIGHAWVKRNYIDATGYGEHITHTKDTNESVEFIPAKVQDNTVLMKNDPNYVKRLENLPENQKKAFLYGDWNIFAGQYFSEFRQEIHVIKPFVIPRHWKRYTTKDYGLDMLANYWITIDTKNNAYIYKELYESDLIISKAAKRIKEVNGSDIITAKYAPPDLWNRRQETGKSANDIFVENGEVAIKATSDRVDGWLSLREWLKVITTKDEQTGEEIQTSKLKIFSNCTNLIRTLPLVQTDEKDANDVAKEPHELTHGPDAIRYFFIMRHLPSVLIDTIRDDFADMREKEYDIIEGDADDSFINY